MLVLLGLGPLVLLHAKQTARSAPTHGGPLRSQGGWAGFFNGFFFEGSCLLCAPVATCSYHCAALVDSAVFSMALQ